MKKPLDLDIRQDLLKSEDVEVINIFNKCPNINVKIQGVKTEALGNTGSEITCNSEFFSKIINLKIVKFCQS